VSDRGCKSSIMPIQSSISVPVYPRFWNGMLKTVVICGLLHVVDERHTMYDMKTSAVTIRIEPDLQKLLDKVCKQSGRTRSDIVRDSLKRQLSIIRFEQLRRQVLPFAEARGYLTDEDANKALS